MSEDGLKHVDLASSISFDVRIWNNWSFDYFSFLCKNVKIEISSGLQDSISPEAFLPKMNLS